MTMFSRRRRHALVTVARSLAGVCIALVAASGSASAQEKVLYLLPAPLNSPAFAPLMIAQHKGYYSAAGLTVDFQVGKGGADVAKQVGAGNADLGGGLGDTPIILRPTGIKVRGVALLGGRPLHQLIIRADREIASAAALKGKRLGVFSFQDTSFYAAQAVLAGAGLKASDADLQALGPSIWQMLASGRIDAMIGAPEFGFMAERTGTALRWERLDQYFPGMAQAILASDVTIAKRPAMVQGFARATLKAIDEIMRAPKTAADDYIKAVPSHEPNREMLEKLLQFYAANIYPGQSQLGAFDPARIEKLQTFYVKAGIVQGGSPVDDLYTNRFVAQ